MAKCENQKQKLLLVKEYFEQMTDPEHPVTVPELLKYLEKRGLTAERKSVYADIQALIDFGMDIEQSPKGYYLSSRAFELPELTLLVDAVQSSKFLSERKSLALLDKLEKLTSVYEASTLRRKVVVTGRIKTINESIYYNVDRIHAAVSNNSQISFKYFDWGVDRQRHFRGGLRTASPYTLIWDDEYYYLLAYTQEHGLTHFRVDKMTEISETGAPRVFTEETRNLDIAAYSKKVFNMFHGETVKVRLRFENKLSGVVIDRFGKDCMLIPDGPEHFVLTTDISVSPMFLGWLAGFGSRVKILSPDSVVQEMKELLGSSLKLYE